MLDLLLSAERDSQRLTSEEVVAESVTMGKKYFYLPYKLTSNSTENLIQFLLVMKQLQL